MSEIANSAGSPGQVFKLPEDDLRTRLSQIEEQTDGVITYTESAMFEQVRRNHDWELPDILSDAYEGELANA